MSTQHHTSSRRRRLVSVMSASLKCAFVLTLTSRYIPIYNRNGKFRTNTMILSVSAWNCRNVELLKNYVTTRRFLSLEPENNSGTIRNTTNSRSVSPTESTHDIKKHMFKKTRQKSKKFKIADEINQKNIDKLASAFDELARKEGFDTKLQYFADDATFEDDFIDDENYPLDDTHVGDETNDASDDKYASDILLNPKNFRLSDFSDEQIDDLNNNDDDRSMIFTDDNFVDDEEDSMDARIAAARNAVAKGRVQVSKQFDDYASDKTIDLSALGFQTEEDPWGIDEKPRKKLLDKPKKEYHLISDAMVCSACGADFQASNENRPGYLPAEKFGIQVKLSKIEELQRLQAKAESKDAEWTPEDEVEWLIQTADTGGTKELEKSTSASVATFDILSTAEQLGLDLEEISNKKVICKRCHGLQNFGKVDDILRPGWTDEPLLSQEKFRDLLRPIREKPAVIVALVDLFDFSGSVLPELDNIAGDNPVILAANKADLLPSKMGHVRAENWVRRELEYMGIRSLANIGGSVRLVSCKTGAGVGAMLAKARSLADEMDCDIYVVGAANAGKSTLLNYILGQDDDSDDESLSTKLRAGNRNKRKSAVTTSPLPGTTLKFIKVDIGGGRSLFDTPGLLVPGTLTHLLTPNELKIVVPKNNVEPVTFRVSTGKAVLVGGLAKIELIEGKPFLFTFFVANGIKLHPTDSSKAEDFTQKHVGTLLVPPLGGIDRLEQLGGFDSHVIDVEGTGWKEAAADITLTGLGWVSVTGAGVATVRVSVPKGVSVSLRPPLMPFDIWESTATYTGSRAVRKTTKTKYGKKRKGVGRN